MLVLSRKVGESIIIGDSIRVMVVASKGDKVRIGIDAPREVRVDREEVHRRIWEFSEPEPVVAIPSSKREICGTVVLSWT